MKRTDVYRYLGTNGVIETPIKIEGAVGVKLIRLSADQGYVLYNGQIKQFQTAVTEDEVENWREIKLDVIN